MIKVSTPQEHKHKQKLEKILAQKKRHKQIKECLKSFCKEFPNVFFSHNRLKPLQIGLHKAVLLHYKGKKLPFSNLIIRESLRRYASQYDYLNALSEGAVRVDLFGHNAGIVTAEQALQASIQKKIVKRKYRSLFIKSKLPSELVSKESISSLLSKYSSANNKKQNRE